MEEKEVESVETLEVAEPIEDTTKQQEMQDELTDNKVVDSEDETVETEETETTQTEDVKEKQSPEDNSAARQARIRAEKEYKDKLENVQKQAYEKGLKEAQNKMFIGKMNPYTEQVIQDEFDIEEYNDMMEIDAKGGDPLKEYSIKQKERARIEAKEQLKKEHELNEQEKSKQDVKDFVDKYPDVNLKEMFKNPKFSKFIDGKIGNLPLIQIYDDYQELVGNFEQEAQIKAKKIVANTKASPGSLSNGSTTELSYKNMSDEQFDKLVSKAERGG